MRAIFAVGGLMMVARLAWLWHAFRRDGGAVPPVSEDKLRDHSGW